MLDASRALEESHLSAGDGTNNSLLDTILNDEQQQAMDRQRPYTSKPLFQPHGGGASGGGPLTYHPHTDLGSPQRRPKTAVVKPQVYHANQTFANFRNATNSDPENKKQVRLRLQNQRAESQSAPGGARARTKVKASWTCSGTQGLKSDSIASRLSRNASSVWAEDMSVYERDTLSSKFVHLGDRVIIDLSTKKGKPAKRMIYIAQYLISMM